MRRPDGGILQGFLRGVIQMIPIKAPFHDSTDILLLVWEVTR